jgi:predicted NAD/FAD-dependent oxidoreductase
VTVIVVGAGVAGVACAVQLSAAGVPVTVLERSRSVGGRMASRRLHGRPVDLGAAYFTVADPEFATLVGRWRTAGLARPWTDQLAVLAHGDRGKAPGPMRWSAPAGLSSLVQALAAGVEVRTGHVVRHVGPGPQVDGEHAEAVVLAMPDPRALRLVHPSSPAASAAADREWRPVIAVAAGWPQRVWSPLPAAFVNGHPTLSLIADDGDRRGDGASVLVAHTISELAREHDAEPEGAIAPVLAALRELLGVDTPPIWTHAHRWRYAAPTADRDEPYHLGSDGIALAGDGWGRPRIETAWRSGTLLGRALAGRFAPR